MINFNCNHAMYDFELASINSFNQRNPLCELTECFLHLSQCMWVEKIQEKCLSTLYVNDHLQFHRMTSQKYPTTTLIFDKYMESIY
ncbi:hypothetical protein HZS_7456 [Henneguya salminicola]|nr:hypothetical protein HZS_7456 [Henneguya salminicola]